MGTILAVIVAVVVVVLGLRQIKKESGVANAKLPLLLPLIQGEVQKGQVLGRYLDLPARGLTFTRRVNDETHQHWWSTQVQLGTTAAWDLVYAGKGLMGLGQKEVLVKAKDKELKARLEASGLLQYMEQVPHVLEGKADLGMGYGWLCFNVRIKDGGDIPTPEAFQSYLQVLADVLPMVREAP
ncbi:MAG: hypothetical protein ACM3XM_09000 [Mycobacterium leprae]